MTNFARRIAAMALGVGLLAGCNIEDRIVDAILEARDTGSDDAGVDGDDGDGGADAHAADLFDWGTPDVTADTTDGDERDDAYFDPDVDPSLDVPEATQPPIIDVIYPARGLSTGGEVVVVEGAYFDLGVEVRIGGVLQSRVDLIDSYQLAFWTEPGSAGVFELKVSTDAGTAAWPGGFEYVDPLRLDRVTPSVASSVGTTEVTVEGAGIASSTRFVVGEREALVSRLHSADRVDLLVAPGPAGTTADLWAFGTQTAVIRDAIAFRSGPRLQHLVPDVGPVEGGIAVRLDAVGVDEECVVWFGARAVAVELTAGGWPEFALPGGVAGPVDVSIDCGERGAFFAPDAFRYVEETTTAVRSVWPPQGFARGGDVVTVIGTGLDGVERVTLGDTVATILRRTANTVDIVTPAAVPGAVDVLVQNASRVVVAPDAFTYIAQPVFVGLEPAAGPLDGFSTVLTGTALATVDGVIIDGVEIAPTATGTTSVSFAVPPGAGGDADVRVRIGALELDTGLDVSRVRDLRFDSYGPREGSMSGGTVVYVRGDGFTDACRVLFDGVPAATSQRGSVLLAAISPPHAEGSATVTIDGCGAWEAPQPFRYIDPTRLPGGVGGGELNGEIRVAVREFNSNAPIAGATVQVGSRSTTLYSGLTDEAGLITFVGADLIGPQTVSAFAPQRSAETYVNVTAPEVTLMLNPLPPPPCEDPSDPACAPPPPPVYGEIVGFLTGLRKVADPPPGAVLAARIETTRQSQGYINPDPGPDGTRYDEGPFAITARLGDQALIALCGYEFVSGERIGEFVPLTMGVVRGITLRDTDPWRTTIDCSDIPLDQTVQVKLTDAPRLVESVDPAAWPGTYRARLLFDFGGEGWFESLPGLQSDSSLLVARGYPLLSGVLDGVRFDVIGGVYPVTGNIPVAEAYARRVAVYDAIIVLPPLLAVPTFVLPTLENPRLTDGYVEWEMPPDSTVPSFWVISASSANAGFPRWTLFVPGNETSFHITDFDSFNEVSGDLPTPGDPAATFSLFVRAVSMDVFDFDDFDRYALRTRGWLSSSATYRNITLASGPAPELPEGSGEAP